MINLKSSGISIGIFILITAAFIVPVSAHGVHVTTNESAFIIADDSTGKLARSVVDNLGVNVTVYKFASAEDVAHELESTLTNPNQKILAVSYTGTVQNFINQHPEVSSRIVVASANENAIQQGLSKLNLVGYNSAGFMTPLLSGLLIGLVFGLGIGAVWMKRKLS
ncbi:MULTISPECIES: hypothetical protein [Methanobacterium]|jgi:formate-dependent phosphoribosylglycinamide formyltransferase (GAR transformylase)|uniref:Uncharacterized protein n=1 Tax=Methanobacterium subterraneum TaxID=59277 RepID=A0A2H4V996_9EURY|nr:MULTISPECIES: hypothetical protein [Methanobacterium]AUB54654.1 hypothetical protein BK007_00525 [Methanobacterium subterraneum]AUB58367.1 hypothetical protein BK008_08600 [Methanobacterium sp. MZ-A1]MBW4257031.1 hypothetical protein [Methanobacterium sp. YSL]NMO08905.1 hypothetical protein [Methanobacterium subterraneum]